MRTLTKAAGMTLVGTGAALFPLGLLMMAGYKEQVIGLHQMLGYLLVLSLWTICVVARRSGVSKRPVTLAAFCGLVALVQGLTHGLMLVGSHHWIIQVLHVIVSVAAIAWGRRLLFLMRTSRKRVETVRSEDSIRGDLQVDSAT